MPNLFSVNYDLATLYFLTDELAKPFIQPYVTGRPSLLTESELLTILIYNALVMHQKTLKEIWKWVKKYHRKDFPKFPQYVAFVMQVNRCLPLMSDLLGLTFAKDKLNFVDSTCLEVCKNHRADDHKVAKNIAKWGRNHQGWHFGFKMHTAINFFKQLTSILFTPADVYDAQALPQLVTDYMKILVGDSHYGASVMRKHIWDRFHILIVAPPHYKQKTKLMTWWQNLLLNLRSKIEATFDILKEHMHLTSSFPRSLTGYFTHYLRVLLGYQFSFALQAIESGNLMLGTSF